MESSSEGEDNCRDGDNIVTPDNLGKPKRKMKTPFQLKILEKSYAEEAYPTEAVRIELSEILGLTDRQLQMWFCHRRLKDKKLLTAKKSISMNVEVGALEGDKMDVDSDPGSGSGSGHSNSEEAFKVASHYTGDVVKVKNDVSIMQSRNKSVESMMELRAIAAVEEQLGGQLRKDGPILGMEFDPLPPNAFEASTAAKVGILKGSCPYEATKSTKASTRDLYEDQYFHDKSINKFDARKRLSQNEDYIIPREVEPREERFRKEMEKQDILRRKMEEQTRKEMEWHDRERRKEEDRFIREKKREEERLIREQRREIERREKFLQKESLRAEKMRQKEELRREKEVARQKSAIERASARKIAKESMELIKDERLELMKLAASNKGLSSITSLDHDTLKDIDSFRDSLGIFPHLSVPLKRPFAIQPWNNSESNIGNLLMVWRFLISFTDVLELWPFTLDEFVQAFHDYDSRLLGEVYISLLKMILKDIEGVARTQSIGPGTNPCSGVSPEGAHPHIVEGAHTWGFSIHSWQQHLNPLTWPEILRQMAMSAGFGPRLKKRIIKRAYLDDNVEGQTLDGVEDIVSTIRNGSAAENAVAMMRGRRGFSQPRKSKHRLTPGTLKFAAFHVLSLEGSKGLVLVELVDKIQKSGLRELTNKAPEASMGVALARDTRLFERIAPSTYRVRTPFRKDPADAEAILSAAREKLKVFQTGAFEKDEDSECDVTEDPETDVLKAPSDKIHEIALDNKGKDPIYYDEENTLLVDTKDKLCINAIGQYVHGVDTGPGIYEQESTEIDESKFGESWVQGLAESEYFNLSVEERLSALVALVNLVNEGNTIRVVLEDRLEAAHALKKQMWDEAQLDKKRFKDENLTVNEKSFADSHNTPNHPNFLPDSNGLVVKDFSVGPDNLLSEQNKYAAEKSREQLKSYIAHRAEEIHVYRSLSLGQDRKHNRYWQFVTSPSSNDPGSGRIFIELYDGRWRLIDTEEAFEALLMSLDTRGIREFHLNFMLKNIETTFKENVRRKLQSSNIVCHGVSTINGNVSFDNLECTASVESPSNAVCAINSETSEVSSSFKIDLGRNETEKAAAFKRYQDLQKWIWKECFNAATLRAIKYGKERCKSLLGNCDLCLNSYFLEDNNCCSCLGTCGTNEKMIFIPIGCRLLKVLLSLIEVCVPLEALDPSWEDHRTTWGRKLHASSSIEDLLKIMTMLEFMIKRDFMASNFKTTQELLGLDTPSSINESLASVPELPWIPHTIAAVTLRLLELDGSIFYVQQQKTEPLEHSTPPGFTMLPSTSKEEAELTEMGSNNVMIKNSKKRRGGQGHNCALVKNVRRRLSDSKCKFRNGSRNHSEKQRRENKQVSGWDRRIVRGKRSEKNIVKETESLPRYAPVDDSDSVDGVESDENAHGTRAENGKWSVSFGAVSDGQNGYFKKVLDDEMECSEDENDSEEDMNERSNGAVIEDERSASACSDEDSD